ncbi:MAG: site-2 protease family protein [Planctomycetaceae bacterium]|nr:site-2 protease family protein [Planctomycetaceae bacterium]
MFGAPQPTPFDIRFVLFRIPVSITPFFWLIGGFLAYNPSFRDDRLDSIAFAVAILAILISILVHELGHALVIRYVFGASTMIFLHGFGGVAIHDRPYYYRTPQRLGRIFISFAGPLAGFLLAVLCWGILRHSGDVIVSGSYLAFFLHIVCYIGVFWGIFNLLPVYPLDGGQIFREICLQVSQRYGMEFSTGISAVMAILLAMFFLQRQWYFGVFLFGVLAYQSIQMLQTRRF